MKKFIMIFLILAFSISANDFSSYLVKRDIDNNVTVYCFTFKGIEYLVVRNGSGGIAIIPVVNKGIRISNTKKEKQFGFDE